MKLYDNPDPRLVSPIEQAIVEPNYDEAGFHDEPFRSDWLDHALKTGSNIDETFFIAFGGAI